MARLAFLVRSHSHAERGRNTRRRMRSSEAIELAFTATWKSTQAVSLAQGRHLLTSTRQNFVRIRLVAYIPHHPVMRRIENIVQGNG